MVGIYVILWLCYCFFVVDQIVSALATGSSFNRIWAPLSYSYLCVWGVCCCFVLGVSLFFDTTRHSSFISFISCISPRINNFSKEASSFYWIIVLKTKIWILGMIITSGYLFLVGPLHWDSNKIYLCILSCVCILSLCILSCIYYCPYLY